MIPLFIYAALPPNFDIEDEEQRREFVLNRKRYSAMVENLDANVGRMTSFLQEEGLADDTVVIFLADHGELGGSHGLRGKQWPYEESMGVPLILRDPRVPAQAGTTIDDPVATEDLFPTFLGLAGLTPQNALMGADLTPLLHGEIEGLEREGVLGEFVAELRQGVVFYDAVWRSFRTQRYKYVVRGDNTGGTPWMFFDLENDPHEMENLVAEESYRDEMARHHQLLRQRMLETEDHFVLLPAWGCAGLNTWE